MFLFLWKHPVYGFETKLNNRYLYNETILKIKLIIKMYFYYTQITYNK